LFMSFPMVGKNSPDYFAYDMLSDILGNGRSSRLYQNLYKKKNYFSKIDAYVTGTADPGLLIIDSRIADGISIKTAKAAIWNQLELLKSERVSEEELQKIKNVIVSTLEFSEINILNKAMNLAYYASFNDIDLINKQREKYNAITSFDLQQIAKKVFRKNNSNTLVYGPTIKGQ